MNVPKRKKTEKIRNASGYCTRILDNVNNIRIDLTKNDKGFWTIIDPENKNNELNDAYKNLINLAKKEVEKNNHTY